MLSRRWLALRSSAVEQPSEETTQEDPDLKMSAVSTTGLVLSLLGLTSLAGAGVAVGSGVSMMYQAMAEEEQKKAAPVHIATPIEKKISVQRSFASKAQ